MEVRIDELQRRLDPDGSLEDFADALEEAVEFLLSCFPDTNRDSVEGAIFDCSGNLAQATQSLAEGRPQTAKEEGVGQEQVPAKGSRAKADDLAHPTREDEQLSLQVGNTRFCKIIGSLKTFFHWNHQGDDLGALVHRAQVALRAMEELVNKVRGMVTKKSSR